MCSCAHESYRVDGSPIFTPGRVNFSTGKTHARTCSVDAIPIPLPENEAKSRRADWQCGGPIKLGDFFLAVGPHDWQK